MQQCKQVVPFERLEFHSAFREVNRDIVLMEHEGWREEIMQLFASLNLSMLASELQKEKEVREEKKEEYIASWKEKNRQIQQDA